MTTSAMSILVANVNTTESMTEAICAEAREFAPPGVQIEGLTPAFGAPGIVTHAQAAVAMVALLDAARLLQEPPDAIVLAGFGEPGRAELEEAVGVPTYDITECAVLLAQLMGRRYSIVTPGPGGLGGPTEERLRIIGQLDRLASMRGTNLAIAELEEDHDRTIAAIVSASRAAIDEDGAEVIILGCAGMAGAAREVQDVIGMPVVSGVVAAVRLASMVHDVGFDRCWPKVDPATFAAIAWPKIQA